MKNIMNLVESSTPHDELHQLCDQAFRHSLPEIMKDESSVSEALRYCLRHPGSLVRAKLAYQTGVTVGLSHECALKLGTGIEYFHTASLLFDDLPCMDDAIERRGFPTVHSIYSQDSAILAALALVNRAYTLIWSAMQDRDISVRNLASDYLDKQLGVCGILGGQSRDVHMKRNSTASEVIRVSYGKTVSLVKLTMVLPAILAGATEVKDLNRLATYWGLAYQVSDDLKDECLSSQMIGKTVKQDALKGRPNIAVAEGYDCAAKRMKHYVSKGDEVLNRLVGRRSEWIFLSTLRKRFEGEVDYWQQENGQELVMTGTE